jgi:pimeloyl-ACP methyl ester carboxylesterase
MIRRRLRIRHVIALALVMVAFFVARRGLLVAFLALKILGHTTALDTWKTPVPHRTVQHAGISMDIYGDSGSPMLIVHGVNPTGKDSPDLVRISQALGQSGFQIFVPDLVGMKQQRLHPEEAEHIKSAFQYIGKDAAIACFSYGCGPAMIAAAHAEIREHVRFAVAFGGYFDIREAFEFVVTGPESPVAYLKWVYLAANSDVIADAGDRTKLQSFAFEHRWDGVRAMPLEASLAENLSPEGRSLLDIFTAANGEDFRARLKAGPEGLHNRLDALSPSFFVDRIKAPLILIHGINDPVIPAQQSIEFAEAARAKGLDYRLTLLRMYGHVHPVLPKPGLTSIFGFYLPEAVRFVRVLNHLMSVQ